MGKANSSRGVVLLARCGRLTSAAGDRAYRCSLYRGRLVLLVGLFRVAILQIRRCGSAFPLAPLNPSNK
jgi:hypothetical protein